MANQNDPKLLGNAVGKVIESLGVFNNRSQYTGEEVTGLTKAFADGKEHQALGDRKDGYSEISNIHFQSISAMAGERMLEKAKDTKVDPRAIPSLVLAA